MLRARCTPRTYKTPAYRGTLHATMWRVRASNRRARRHQKDARMLTINGRPEPTLDTALLDRLRTIPPAAAGHIFEHGFMDNALRPFGRRRFVLCGPAVTVRALGLDSAVVHHAIAIAQPGDVLVIDRGGNTRHAAWGELTSLAATLRGLAGTLIDGAVTDIVEIEELQYLVFAREVAPITTRAIGAAGEINTVVLCGGVQVAPGDIILADDNGILVIPPAQVVEVIAQCEPRLA